MPALWLPTYSADLDDTARDGNREKERYFAKAPSPGHGAFESRVRARLRAPADVARRRFPRREGRRLQIQAVPRNSGVDA